MMAMIFVLLPSSLESWGLPVLYHHCHRSVQHKPKQSETRITEPCVHVSTECGVDKGVCGHAEPKGGPRGGVSSNDYLLTYIRVLTAVCCLFVCLYGVDLTPPRPPQTMQAVWVSVFTASYRFTEKTNLIVSIAAMALSYLICW